METMSIRIMPSKKGNYVTRLKHIRDGELVGVHFEHKRIEKYLLKLKQVKEKEIQEINKAIAHSSVMQSMTDKQFIGDLPF